MKGKMSSKRHLLIALAMVISVVFPATISMADLKDGLVAYYPLDDNAEDSVGANHGEAKGDAAWEDRSGFGQTLVLDGDGDYVEVQPDPAFDELSEEFTIAAWMFMTLPATPDTDRRTIVSREFSPDANRGFEFRVSGDTQELGFQLVRIDGGAMTKIAVESGFKPDLNTWYHVAGTYDRKKGAEFFVNGKFVDGVKTFTGAVNTAATPLNIGAYLWPGHMKYFGGKIDELGLWSRVLTPQEISSLASGTVFPFPVEPAGKLATVWGRLK